MVAPILTYMRWSIVILIYGKHLLEYMNKRVGKTHFCGFRPAKYIKICCFHHSKKSRYSRKNILILLFKSHDIEFNFYLTLWPAEITSCCIYNYFLLFYFVWIFFKKSFWWQMYVHMFDKESPKNTDLLNVQFCFNRMYGLCVCMYS